jgi:sialic acid synthase SpsE
LSGIFGCGAGVSDHSLDPVLVPVLAQSLGAAVIEKHFCLSRTDPGLDDPIALPPGDFAAMVKTLRRTFAMEKGAAAAEIAAVYGAETVEKVLGDGVKRLAACEKANYERTRRSVHALRAVKKGDTITGDNVAVLRTEKTLRPGLSPKWAELITGKQAKNDISSGQGIRLEDVF